MNELKPSEDITRFKSLDVGYSVSARRIRPDIDLLVYLSLYYNEVKTENIRSVFGNTAMHSPLYGGRPFRMRYAITRAHLATMYDHNIGLALTLTNHFFNDQAYKDSLPLLREYHRKGNSVVCTNDALAQRLKNDFPDYELKASVIKNLNTVEEITQALELYDAITLPMELNNDNALLEALPHPEKIILFGNAGCALTCPSRDCYMGISKLMFGMGTGSTCSRKRLPRKRKGYIYFDIGTLKKKGFSQFKLIPTKDPEPSGNARKLSRRKNHFYTAAREDKGLKFVYSYPKCGRTWLRFILALYLHKEFDLELEPNLFTMFSTLPNYHGDKETGEQRYRHSDDDRFPLISFTHSRPYHTPLFKQNPGVLLLRQIPDVVVSEYYHRTEFMGVFSGSIKEFVTARDGGLVNYVNYLNAWAGARREMDVTPVTYEALHTAPMETMENVLEIMGLPRNGDVLGKAVEQAEFQRMQKMEESQGMPWSQSNNPAPNAKRMRKGKVAGYKDELPVDILGLIIEYCRTHLSPEAREMLRENHIDI